MKEKNTKSKKGGLGWPGGGGLKREKGTVTVGGNATREMKQPATKEGGLARTKPRELVVGEEKKKTQSRPKN